MVKKKRFHWCILYPKQLTKRGFIFTLQHNQNSYQECNLQGKLAGDKTANAWWKSSRITYSMNSLWCTTLLNYNALLHFSFHLLTRLHHSVPSPPPWPWPRRSPRPTAAAGSPPGCGSGCQASAGARCAPGWFAQCRLVWTSGFVGCSGVGPVPVSGCRAAGLCEHAEREKTSKIQVWEIHIAPFDSELCYCTVYLHFSSG